MNTTQQTSKEYFKTLNILFYALLSGQVFFLAIVLFLSTTGQLPPAMPEYSQYFIAVLLVAFALGLLGHKTLVAKRLEDTKKEKELNAKTAGYRSALILRWALIEGPSFLGIVLYTLGGGIVLLVLIVLIIGFFIALKPGIDKMITELELSREEQKLVETPYAIIAEVKNTSV